MDIVDRLRHIPLFADLPVSDLEHLGGYSVELQLPAGTRLFEEGADGEDAYVIADGQVEILKRSLDRDVLLAVREPGEVIGEMALLQDAPRMAAARARTDATLIRIPKSALDHLIDHSPTAARALFAVILGRLRDTEARLRQSEKMAQIGSLTAGLAHELNNPAAAAKRAADQLGEAIEAYGAARAAGAVAAQPALVSLLERVTAHGGQRLALGALERSDREDALASWLDARGLPDAWAAAGSLVDLGLAPADLEPLDARDRSPAALTAAVELLRAAHEVRQLLYEVGESTSRLSAIVRALKSYSYLDQAPVQRVDVAAGLDDTLLILRSKLDGVEVVREFAPDLAPIDAYGSELNQVWTNLIDNAADAVRGQPAGQRRITLRAANEDGRLVVEVEDSGSGIPPEIQGRIFDAFFTTKPPGSGTGLGLDISYGIVVERHRGELCLVSSEPGRTVFRVDLPAQIGADPAR